MNRSLRITSHAQACALLNALREHRDTPYYQGPLDTPEKRQDSANMYLLVQRAHEIYEAFVEQAWRESQPDDDR